MGREACSPSAGATQGSRVMVVCRSLGRGGVLAPEQFHSCLPRGHTLLSLEGGAGRRGGPFLVACRETRMLPWPPIPVELSPGVRVGLLMPVQTVAVPGGRCEV